MQRIKGLFIAMIVFASPIILITLAVFLISTGNSPLNGVEEDYSKYQEVFQQVISEEGLDEYQIIRKDDYDQSKEYYRIIFEELGYDFIRIDENVFFCKTYQFLDGCGIIFVTNPDSIYSPKEHLHH